MRGTAGDPRSIPSDEEGRIKRRLLLRLGTWGAVLSGATAVSTHAAGRADAAARLEATMDPAAAADLYVPKWKPSTAYPVGQPVISPAGDTVTSLRAHTSGQAFGAADWCRNAVNKGELYVSVTDYGAKGDWKSGSGTGTDNLGPFNAALKDALARGAGLFIPAGKYRFSNEWNVYRPNNPRSDLIVTGEDQLTTFLVADFYGAGKSLVKCVDPAGATRSSPTSFRNLQFGTVDRKGPNPVLLDIAGWGESRAEGLRFGPCNNTHMRLSSVQNVRLRDIVSFYGGSHYNYRSTDGLVFNVSAAGELTASGPVFAAQDVGKGFVVLTGNPANRARLTITAVADARRATVQGNPSLEAASNAAGCFAPAQASIAKGSTTMVADGPCFTPASVGKVLIVRGARSGPWGAANLRAAVQSYVSPTTVVLDRPADIAVSRGAFANPVVDLYSHEGAGTLAADTNDVKWDTLHIENYAGVAVAAARSIFLHLDKMKIHAEHGPTDGWASTSHMWLDDVAGAVNGELDGTPTGDTRIHFSNMNDLLTIEWLATRRIRGETLFTAAAMPERSGLVEIKSLNSYSAPTSGNPYSLVSDASPVPSIIFSGLVNMIGDPNGPRIYLGKDLYIGTNGGVVRGASTASGFDSVLSSPSGSRMLFEDLDTKKYSIGNTAGGGQSFTITDETLSLVRLLIGGSGSVVAGADNAQALGSSTVRWKDVYATAYRLGPEGKILHTSGNGSPEGVVTAPVGSEYTWEGGKSGSIRFVKKSGSGNKGWVAIW